MRFRVTDMIGEYRDTVYLIKDKWNDWFRFETQYQVRYVDESGNPHLIGHVKIGERGQTENSPNLPKSFCRLGERFFSIGASSQYYLTLQKMPSEKMETILSALNDMAYNIEIFESVRLETVVSESLMRDYSIATLRGQLNRMAHGGARLTDYSFSYFVTTELGKKKIELNFDVFAESKPPTNIHAIIGKNGVGKTSILKNMLRSTAVNGPLESGDGFSSKVSFSNVVYVSYSAFDMPIFKDDLEQLGMKLPYTYVGLIADEKEGKHIKGIESLAYDYCQSLYNIEKGNKKRFWHEIIAILDSDNTFKNNEIGDWAEKAIQCAKVEGLNTSSESEFNVFKSEVSTRFKRLSSGHKIILLTLAKLVEVVEEKSLVVLDEPEEHLHPPLVSAFIRALSRLLTYRNGVGILATHSPVIVQEIPKKCVWKIRRENAVIVAERPNIETFGENLGELTSEIFGYEVLNSGFHKMLYDEAKKTKIYEHALAHFSEELGKEARSILKAYIYERNHDED